MARDGWSAANFLRYNAAIVTGYPCTIALWFYPTATTTSWMAAALNSASTTGLNQIVLEWSGSKVAAGAADGSSLFPALSSVTGAINTWHHACGVFASATDRRAFLDGGNKGTSTTSKVPSGINRFSVGLQDNAAANSPFPGRLAEVAVWNIALADGDVAMLGKGLWAPLIHPESLVAYWPIIGVNSPENNIKSNTATLSLTGAPTKAVHPRIFMPRHKLIRI